MKQFSISVFLLLFHYCFAPHFGCPKDRPFLWNNDKCGSFSDICIKYRSEDCEFGIKACEQCPMSNFSSAILDRVLRTIYGGENKNGSQTKNETKPIQESSTNGVQWFILTIVVLLFIFTILIFLVTITEWIRKARYKSKQKSLKQEIRNLMEMKMKKTSDEIQSLKDDLEKKEKEHEKNVKDLNDKIAKKQIELDDMITEIGKNRTIEENLKNEIRGFKKEICEQKSTIDSLEKDIRNFRSDQSKNENRNSLRKKTENPKN